MKWAIGAEKGTSPVGEEDQAVPDDDELRRLFTALDYESSRAPASPSVGGKGVTGRERVRGWVALTLDIRATEVSRGSLRILQHDSVLNPGNKKIGGVLVIFNGFIGRRLFHCLECTRSCKAGAHRYDIPSVFLDPTPHDFCLCLA